MGGVALKPLWAQVWSAAQGGSGSSVAGGTAAHAPSFQRQSRPSDQTHSAAFVISAQGCGGGGGGGSAHSVAFQVQRRAVRQPSGLQNGVPTAASHAVWFSSRLHFVSGQGASGRQAVPGSGQCGGVWGDCCA